MFNAVPERREAKIQNKPDRKIQHSQIGAALGGKNRMPRADSLQFDHYLAINKQVNSFWMVVILTEYIALIHDWTCHLASDSMTSMRQFPRQRRLVGLFFQAAAKFGMDFNCGIDYLACQVGIHASVICLIHIIATILQDSKTPRGESNHLSTAEGSLLLPLLGVSEFWRLKLPASSLQDSETPRSESNPCSLRLPRDERRMRYARAEEDDLPAHVHPREDDR